MSAWRHIGWAIAALLCIGAAHAQVTRPGYSSAKLGDLWGRTLGSAAPQLDLYRALAPAGDLPDPAAAPAPDLGIPFGGTVLGETATGGGTQQRVFPVLPLPSADAAVLMPRLAWSEMYLARYRAFTPFSTDTADDLARLTERQYAAGLEAWLITARLYFAARDLPGKCARLTRLREISAGPLSGIAADRLPPAWRDLLSVRDAAQARLEDGALAALVCAIQPVRGRAETVRLVETRVREKIVAEVRAKVSDTLVLLDASAETFTDLVNRMDVTIASAAIIELERVLGNAAANMVLVRDDQLNAAQTLQTLAATDLSSLNKPAELAEFAEGRARMDAVTGQIGAVLAELAHLADPNDGDPALAGELAPCAALQGLYDGLDMSRDSGALTAQVSGPYTACLNAALGAVGRMQTPDADTALIAELARHVRQISETHLATVSP
ncbi:hypothetical protein [Paracoccus sp. SSK6]|uniref:hypothetical protein n=1 Tax=Paracoccus sp. SSK6 TaxID=3143131 RepID=UPI00321AEC78